MNKRVLLTGASGFIGRHSIPHLLAHGYEVHAMTRTQDDGLAEWAGPGVSVHPCDLFDTEAQRRLFSKVRPTHLLHFAWFTEHGQFWTSSENLKWVSASLSLLQNFVEAGGVRAVYAGTCAEYEWKDKILSEAATPLVPRTLYGVCKNSLQLIYAHASAQWGLSSAWGRIFFIYGPHEGPSRLVSTAIRACLRGESKNFTHGRQVRDFIFVEDLARAFTLLLDSKGEGPFNLATGVPVTLQKIISRVGELTGRSDLLRLGALEAPADEPEILFADVTRLHQATGFVPQFNLDEGLRKSIDWWRTRLN